MFTHIIRYISLKESFREAESRNKERSVPMTQENREEKAAAAAAGLPRPVSL